MYNRLKYSLICILLLLFGSSKAQLYPAEAIFNLSPPFPVYLSDYANPMGNNISLRLLYRDFNIGTRTVKLRFSLIGQNIQISNLPSIQNLPEFTITAGSPLNISQAELYPYFLQENLDISPQIYAQALPEGLYRFGVEIIDSESNRAISGQLLSMPYWFVVNEPPIINLPTNNSKVQVLNPQNLIFQWVPRTKQAAAIEYEFTLTELFVPDAFEGNLQNLFLSQPPYFQSTTRNTTLLYGPAEPPLIENRYYGVRVQAKARKGLETVGIFRNEGYSEIFTFQYGNAVNPLSEIQQNVTEKSTIDMDAENYLTGFNTLISQKDLPATATTAQNTGLKLSQKFNLGDSLRLADLWFTVAGPDYLSTSISVPNFGTKTIKLYPTDSLVVTNKNELQSRGLNTLPLGYTLTLKDSLKSLIVPKQIVNKPNLFGSLLLLEDAKNTNNNVYHDIRAHAIRKPNEIRELNLKLNGYLVLLRDKATLMDRILSNYSNSLVFDEVNPIISREKKKNEANINNIQAFLKKYESYYKDDFAQQVLKYFPDAPSNSMQMNFYSDLIQLELEKLAKEKIAEKEAGVKKLKDEHDEKLRALGSIPANMNTGETKRLDEKLDSDIIEFNKNLDIKYEKLKNEVYARFKKLTSNK